MGKPRQNPFRPGLGKCPPRRVGHERASRDLGWLLGNILRGRAGGYGIMEGCPGVGKTSLLAEAARLALDKGAAVRVVSGKGAKEHPELARRILGREDGVGGEIPRGGPKVRWPGSILGLGGHRDPSLGAVLKATVDAAPTFLVIVDAHLMGVPAAKALLSGTQILTSGERPLALVVSGSASLSDVLMGTNLSFWDRGCRLKPSGLEDAEVAEALSVPAEDAGRAFDADALELAVRESHGYPLFVQMLGAAAWQSAADSGAGRISLAAVQDGVARIKTDQDAFFSDLRAAVVEAGALPEAEAVSKALVDAGDAGQISAHELVAALKAAGPDGKTKPGAFGWLLDVGLVESVVRDSDWKPGVPGLFRHIAERAGEQCPARQDVRRRPGLPG